jgi:hypothetical protein
MQQNNQQLKINNSTYTVEFVDGQNHSLSEGKYLGVCYTTSKHIFVSQVVPNKRVILRHEIAHAVIYEFLGTETVWNEEKVCEFYERYYQILEDLVAQIYIEGE